MPSNDLDRVVIVNHLFNFPEQLILSLVEFERSLNFIDAKTISIHAPK